MIKSLLALLSLSLIIAFSGALSTDIVEYKNFEYQYFPLAKIWDEAEHHCQIWGGHLVSVLDEAEELFVKTITDKPVWTGLKDFGDVLDWIGDNLPFRKRFINGFNPWDIIPIHDPLKTCVFVDPLGNKWDFSFCTAQRHFVCKRPVGDCQWTGSDNAIGAPKPIVTTKIENSKLKITVAMAQKESKSINYALAFSDLDVSAEQCASGEDAFDSAVWSITRRSCQTIFETSMTLEEFIAKSNPSFTSEEGSDIIRITGEIFTGYMNNDDEKYGCVLSKHSTEITVLTILRAYSRVEAEIGGDGIDPTDPLDPDGDGNIDPSKYIFPLYFATVNTNDEGRLLIDTLVVPRQPQVQLDNFEFVGHSRGLGFSLDAQPVDCSSPQSCCFGCSQRLILISSSVEDIYTGRIVVGFNIAFSERPQKVYNTSLNLHVEYEMIEDPSVMVSTMETQTFLVSANDFSQPVNSFTPFERTYLMTRIPQGAPVPNAQLAFDDVFLCCSIGRNPLPPYNPSAGQWGCTQQDMRIMSFWAPLVLDGEAQDEMGVEFEELGPLVRDRVVLSFEANGIFGEDRLCYIHSRTDINLIEGSKKRKAAQPSKEEKYQSDSVGVVTFKTCSAFNNKQQCNKHGICAWNNKRMSCVYDSSTGSSESFRYGSSSGASSIGGVHWTAVAVLGAMLGLVFML